MIFLKYLSLILLLLSLLIFFFGFLPKTEYKKRIKIDQNYFKKRTIDNVILIVVDSLRYDMVYNKRYLWKGLNKILNESWAYQTIAELQPPSMSLPKIKSIITGAVINYIDVIFNTDAGEMKQENIIEMTKKFRNFNIDLYGDETWAKLFPNKFTHSVPMSPFFVRDFFDIDNQISENVPNIVSNVDNSNFVIMHYLGLDHIGHAVGPYSVDVDNKLIEMDKIISALINGIFTKDVNSRTLIVFTADHGMSDLGGHGGSSHNELNVPLIFFNKRFIENSENSIETIYQIDIAPSLALLLGIPIPNDNIGVIPYRLLSLIKGSQHQMNALYSNYFQLIKNVPSLPKSIINKISIINSSISNIQHNCRNNSSNCSFKELAKEQKALISIMNDIKKILITKSIHHNFLMLEMAFTIVSISLLICLSCFLKENGLHITCPGFIFIFSLFSFFISALHLENLNICLLTSFKISFNIILFLLTGYTITGAMKVFYFIMEINWLAQIPQNVILLSLFMNLFSYTFPTFIIEEHQIWFFISATLVNLFLIKEIVIRILIKDEQFLIKSTYGSASLILLVDRILRMLNRTGERWTSIPNIGDWLIKPENNLYLIIVISCCLPIVGLIFWEKNYVLLSVTVQFLIVLNAIHRLADIKKFRIISDISVWLYYAVLGFQICFLITFKLYFKLKSLLKLSNIIFLLSFLICRDQNIVLWTGIAIKRVLIRQLWLEEIQSYNTGIQFIIFNILGMSSFYQQGNANSLTTIDVLPGFVGMPSYIPCIVNPLVAIHLFSGNIFWIFTWFEWLSEKQSTEYVISNSCENQAEKSVTYDEDVSSENDNYSIDKGLHIKNRNIFPDILLYLTMISALFTLSIFFFSILHKHEILAWSIYAPKLFYHCFHFGIIMILYILIAMYEFL